jgi:hypothetical protein
MGSGGAAQSSMENYANDFTVAMETVRAVVTAYGDGRIELEKPPPKTSRDQLRYAPSFVQGCAGTRARACPYTSETIRNFLEWPETRAKHALQALSMSDRN